MEVNSITFDGENYAPYINDDGIYVPVVYCGIVYYQCVVTKDLFVEAYNKWIKLSKCNFARYGEDTADDWSE